MARRVPYQADEKTSLVAALNRHRDAILWKLQGLNDEQLRWPGVPSGTTLLGLVKHLAFVENGWFCETFGEPFEAPPFDESDPEADLRIEADETAEEVLAYYERARAAADASIAKHDLEDLGTAWFGDTVTMRWALVHMVQEVSRHAGHADIVRELIDGSTGDHDTGAASADKG
jgi:uncharacterized damage-inducible protein DinB